MLKMYPVSCVSQNLNYIMSIKYEPVKNFTYIQPVKNINSQPEFKNQLEDPLPESSNSASSFVNSEMVRHNIFFKMLEHCLDYNTRITHGYPYQSNQGIHIFKSSKLKRIDGLLKIFPPREAERNSYCSNEYMKLSDREISDILEFNKSTIHEKQSCLRCRKSFKVKENGSSSCFYHFGKKQKSNQKVVFSCCNLDLNSPPCFSYPFHIFNNIQEEFTGPYLDFISTQNIANSYQIYGMDCEMVYTNHGFEVARVSVVSHSKYEVMLNTYVRPEGEVYDFCSSISGIKPDDIINAPPLHVVRKQILNLISCNDILVGHGLNNDLICLKIIHRNVLDTSLLSWNENQNINDKWFQRPSLKFLAENYLGKQIHTQDKGHDSVEDASVALKLAEKFIYKS